MANEEIKEDITVPEIKKELEALGVTYDDNAHKDELYELLVIAREEAAASADSDDEAVDSTDPEPEGIGSEDEDPQDDTADEFYYACVTAKKLNIRSEPSDDPETVRYVVLQGGILNAVGESKGWTLLADGNVAKSEFLMPEPH